MSLVKELRKKSGLELFGVADAASYDATAPEGGRAREWIFP
ncbi:MAG: hypothetical protein ACYC55_08120 [Candidatus Geothermincolia bacterium]